MIPTPSKVYDIYFDPSLQCVVMIWNGYATSRQFREGTEYMLEVLQENAASKVLADIRDMTIIGMEDQQWLTNDFLPRAIAGGFRFVAMLRPHAYFNKVAVETVSYKIQGDKLSINYFDNREDAVAWLTKQ
jgi:hypothetical protein